MLKFPIYDVDFGDGKPLLILPDDLADQIEFEPLPDKSGVEIIFRGYLAKNIEKSLIKENGLIL